MTIHAHLILNFDSYEPKIRKASYYTRKDKNN